LVAAGSCRGGPAPEAEATGGSGGDAPRGGAAAAVTCLRASIVFVTDGPYAVGDRPAAVLVGEELELPLLSKIPVILLITPPKDMASTV